MPEPATEEIREAIAKATTYYRHVHAANHPCSGCIDRATKAVVELLREKNGSLEESNG